jgi:TusA-related sulfurtransferase
MAEFTLDCLGEACPIPLLKIQKKWPALKLGDVLIVHIDHSCALKNIPEWARKDGHNVEVDEVDEGTWDIYIEKNV